MISKILVGCPTSQYQDYCLDSYAKVVSNLTYSNYDILLVDNSKDDKYYNKLKKIGIPVIKGPWFEGARDRIVESRNILRKTALDKNYDYFLSLEQDVIPPKDVIQRLLSHKKDVVSGLYFNYNTVDGKNILVPMLWGKAKKEDEILFIDSKSVIRNSVISVGACGLGCVLINKKVLEKVKFRYDPKKDSFDDMYFSLDVHSNGFDILADTSVKCKHLIKERHLWDDVKK